MAAEDRSHILPLESIHLAAVPLTTHNIAWSADAELAIGADECVWIYNPEFPSAETSSNPPFRAGQLSQHQFYAVALKFPVVELRRPELNRPLFATAKQEFPEFESTPSQSGMSIVTNIGSSINHVVALEWSPNGLGRLKRCVLAVLTGSGALTIYLEGVPSDGMEKTKIKGRNVRSIHSWYAAWSVGGEMLVPRAKKHVSPYSKEYITSFAWARDSDDGCALLAYANDEDEIVILSVQSRHNSSGEAGDVGEWRVEELARFEGSGPHPKSDLADPDSCPSGSSFSLRWSPWLKRSWNKTAILSYICNNYVGFREVTIRGVPKPTETPKVEVSQADCDGICIHLAPNAFVMWEDLVWTIDSHKVCRGVIATPAVAEPFEVAFDDSSSSEDELNGPHSTDECGTTYPEEEDLDKAANPIVGLVLHPPNLTQLKDDPYFSLVRMTVTPDSLDWYETNLPLPLDPTNPEQVEPRPRWATGISDFTVETKPYPLAYRMSNPRAFRGLDMETGEVDDEDDNDGNGMGSDKDGDEDDSEDEEDLDKTEYFERMNEIGKIQRIHTKRVRVWGMATSPGGGTTAAFVSVHDALKPDRDIFSGLDCRVVIGRNIAPMDETFQSMKKLSTEALMWEWMYGGGPPVPGASRATLDNDPSRKLVTDKFHEVGTAQQCPLCKNNLVDKGKRFQCIRGHFYEKCVATEVPIVEPGISNMCAVCGSKCLKPEYLEKLAPDLAPFIEKEISGELCGGCGGKFIG